MTRSAMHRLAIGIAVLGAIGVGPAHAQRRPIAEKDLFKFVWVADPQISPDGSQIAFVRVAIDDKKDAYETSIWIARADGSEPPRAFTSGIRDTNPRWAPDGRRLAFVRAVEKDGRPQPPQIHLIAMAGGEPWAITEVPRGAGNPEWAPDGRTIAFSTTTRADELAPKPAGDKPRESDVRVITDAVYRANGVAGIGYVDRDRPSHIWTVAVPSGPGERPTAKAVTAGEFGAGNARWSRDGAQDFLRLGSAPRVVLLSARQRSLRRRQGRRRAGARRQHRRHHRRLCDLARRQAGRVRRRAGGHTRAIVHAARSLGRRSGRRAGRAT